jgi:hypothetical protein
MLGSNPSADPRTRPKRGAIDGAPFFFFALSKLRDGTKAINPLMKSPVPYFFR